MIDEEALLTFNYRVIALWKLDAREYVQKRIIGMYTLLPGMEGANASLLLEAIRDMEQQFSRSDFVRHLRRFRRILQRSETVSEQDKKIVEDYMDIHYDSLLDEDPEVQEREVRARVSELRQMVIEAVESEYPSLVELARERVVHIEKPDLLRQMVKLIFKASDESMARWVLSTF